MAHSVILRIFFLFWMKIVVSQKIFEYTVSEERPSQTVIGNLLVDANLHEKYRSNQLTFSFLKTNGHQNGYILLEGRTGILRTATKIDRDNINECRPNKHCVFDLDVAVGPREFFEILKVKVIIRDINDNKPTFPDENVYLTIPESRPLGIAADLPEAIDIDSGVNSIQGYKTISDNQHFKISNVNGDLQLVLRETLDRETKSHYKLRIIAYDGGVPKKSGALTVQVSVSDVNDNFPKFQNTTYVAKIYENAALHTQVIQVRAVDGDAGVNARITYSFTKQTSTEYGQLFTIDKDSGVIYLNANLNYKRAPNYELSVTAKDHGTDPLSARCKVMVKVIDINDHAPQITIQTLDHSGDLKIAENAAKGSVIAHVSVYDQDSGLNGLFDCKLDTRYFTLHSLLSGGFKLVTAIPLDREVQKSYRVKITCIDQGKPPLSSSRLMMISIVDTNDNPPVFSRHTYFAKIRENNPVGKTIVKLNATDKDEGKNAAITYKIDHRAADLVRINPSSGILTSVKRFDHEKMQDIEVIVYALDQGIPSFTATSTVFITILDINDEKPKFSVSSYDFHILEKKPAGSKVGKVYATDADSHPNNKFTFSIEGNNEMSSAFTIDAQDGGIRTARVLSKVNGSLYHFIVVATEIELPRFATKANVSVYVVDRVTNTHIQTPFQVSLPQENLVVILSLSGSLAFLLLILVFVVACVCKRRRRHTHDDLGYLPGNLIHVTHRESDVARTKSELMDRVDQTTWEKLFNIQSVNHLRMDKEEQALIQSCQMGYQGFPKKTTSAQQAAGNADTIMKTPLGTPGDSPRSVRTARRSSQNSKSSDARRSADGRRKAADGASDSRISYNRYHGSRTCQSVDKELHNLHKGPRRHRHMRDSDSACSADVSNSDSGNCASDDPERRRSGRSKGGTLRSRYNVNVVKNRGGSKKNDIRRVKAESLSSPDSEVAAYRPDSGGCHSRDEEQATSSPANRIALVHPQRNGDKNCTAELGEEMSLSDSCQEAPGSSNEGPQGNDGPEEVMPNRPTDVIPYQEELDSDSGSSDGPQGLAPRARPEGQSQSRQPKGQPGQDKNPPYQGSQGSCVNDTDFYESDSESRGRNILV